MTKERPELPIERLLLAFVRASQGEASRDTKTGALLMRQTADAFQAAWEHYQKLSHQERFYDWERWGELNMAITVYNKMADVCNLPEIQVPNINPPRGTLRQGPKMEEFATALMRAGEHLKALDDLIEEALRHGKFRPDSR
ncbi:MAG: hypothetical protein P8J32_03955 [bacterium]|jgi:hypothetical protein|nr:hypothetical protein [bacterium]